MTSKHRFLFYLFRIKCLLNGVFVGKILWHYSEEKSKYIKCCITSIGGDSITNDHYHFYIGVSFFEPTQGNDSRCFNWGSYSLMEMSTKFKTKRPKNVFDDHALVEY